MKKSLRIPVLTAIASLMTFVNASAITEVDGVYQIATAADLVEFGQLVTSENNALKCVITADLDFTGVNYTPIGSAKYLFKGSINGQGHKISNLTINTTNAYTGLVGYIGNGAEIKNLIIDNTCSITGGNYTGAFAGASTGSGTAYFENLGNEANVSGGTNTAAIVGVSMSAGVAFIIKNCYNTGDVTGTKESAIITGWMGSGSKVTNFYNVGSLLAGISGTNKLYRNSATLTNVYDIEGVQGDSISEEIVASGVLAFALNGFSSENCTWYQTLGEDMYPIFDSTRGTVYYAGTMNCDMSLPEDYADYGFSNTNVTKYTDHDYVDGVCSACRAPQAGYLTLVDSVYEIASAKDLNWFAAYVNTLEDDSVYARLTADIDFTEYSAEGIMISDDSHYFRGWFDGQGHTVAINYDTDVKYGGLFRYLAGTVKNLAVTGDYVGAANLNGPIEGYVSELGVLENCVSSVNMVSTKEGDASMGGVAGQVYSGVIRNCAFVGTFDGPAAFGNGGIVAWSSNSPTIENCFVNATFNVDLAGGGNGIITRNSSVTNCYYIEDGGLNGSTGASQATLEQLGNGELAYLLNSMRSDTVSWYQNIDNDQELDEMPWPFSTHGVVYAVGTLNCDGSPASSEGYSNTNKSVQTPHNYVYGVCDFCKTIKKDYLTPVDGYYEIASAEDLYWFALYVNTVNNGVNGKLTADIDFTKYSADSVTIGSSSYSGTFNGQGHDVKIAYKTHAGDNASAGHFCRSLFGIIQNATIKNLSTSGTIDSWNMAGGIAVSTRASRIENCYSSVTLSTDREGDCSLAGITGDLRNHCVITNCGFAGSIEAPSGTGNGGICAYTHAGIESVIENTYVASTSLIASGDNNAIFCRNNPTIYNCYYIDPGTFTLSPDGIEVTEDQVKSGELCYILNGNVSGGEPWTQTLGTDYAPLPFTRSEKVYAIDQLGCDGTPNTSTDLTFSNTQGELVQAEHEFDSENVCGYCNAHKIENGEQLNALSEAINSGFANGDITVIVANDIDLADYPNYVGIGTEACPFMGTFEGNGHVISNMNITSTENYQGLFGVVSAGAYIKDITVDNTCSINVDGSYVAGIAGSTTGTGLITLVNCGNEASVTATGANAAGIIGVNMGSNALLRLTNCYNAGKIVGGKESAGISGWLGKSAELTNCYNVGEVEGYAEDWTSYRCSTAPTVVNCYALTGSQFTKVTDDQVKNGELCYLLNDSVSGGDNYFQTLGTDLHPILFATHAKVYAVNGTYTNDLTGIKEINSSALKGDGIERIYTIDGVRVQALQKGVNIIRKADGTVKKVLVK